MNLLIDYGGTFFRFKLGNTYKKLKSNEIDLIEFIEAQINKYNIKNIGISFAGQVNNGKILSAPNIKGLNGFDIKGYFENKYKVNVLIENDLKCAAIAEKFYFKSNHIAVIYVGTGLGAAFIENELIRGFKNLAGELGHIPYKKTSFVCGCGKNNCLELTCSGKAMKLRGIEKLEDDEDFKKEFNNALNYAIEVVSIMLNPKLIVLGGGVIKNNKFKIEPYLPSFTEVKVEMSKLEDGAIEGLEILMKERRNKNG